MDILGLILVVIGAVLNFGASKFTAALPDGDDKIKKTAKIKLISLGIVALGAILVLIFKKG